MENSAHARCSARYGWRVSLPVPAAGDPLLNPATMTASELMFFFGAPFSHVARYEEHLRTKRLEGRRMGASRLARRLSLLPADEAQLVPCTG